MQTNISETPEILKSLKSAQEYIEKTSEEIAAEKKKLGYLERRQYDSTQFADQYKTLLKYQSMPNTVLFTKYLCTFTIRNPAIGNLEQEISLVYYIDSKNAVVGLDKPEVK